MTEHRSDNPFSPPRAQVEDSTRLDNVPALWNPNAAAGWSLLFSPAFGAYLHMKNWEALGEPEMAASSRTWFISTLVLLFGLLVGGIFMPESKAFDALTRPFGLILFISWFMANGKTQAKYFKEQIGPAYPRKGWGIPLLVAVLGVFAFLAIGLAIILAIDPTE